jgi:hypothetical protein
MKGLNLQRENTAVIKAYTNTNASIVMLPRATRMYIAAGPPCENEYQAVDV